MGNLTFVLAGWGKLNRKCKVPNDFPFLVPEVGNSLNTCLDEMEEFKGRDTAISQVTGFFPFSN